MRKLLFIFLLLSTTVFAGPRCDGIYSTQSERDEYYTRTLIDNFPSNTANSKRFLTEHLTKYEFEFPQYPKLGHDWYLLEETEKLALFEYSTSAYSQINSQLRNNNVTNTLLFRMMCSAINHLPSFDTKKILYRVVNLPENIFQSMKETMLYTDAAFMSTSYVRVPSLQNPHLLIIKAYNGKKIQAFSHFTNEHEVLMPPGSKFKVLSIKQNEEVPKLVIELEELM